MENPRVRIFSDELISGPVLSCGLALNGFSAEWASDGGLGAHGFDAAIVDLESLGMRGYEICRQVKRLGKQLIIICNFNGDGTIACVLEADYSLSKPFSMQTMISIARELSRAGAAA